MLSGFSNSVPKVSAQDNDSNTTVITVDISSGDDAKYIIQQALNTNRYNSKTPLKVIVPPGTYRLSDHLILYSNTYLECKGATFIKNFKSGTMLAIGLNTNAAKGHSYYRNITIHGGTFDADGKSGKKTGSILKFSHTQNMVISNVTFKNCCNAHHIGFAGCKNVKITNCTFQGHYSSENKSFNREAIQLDILEKYHFPDLAAESYDGTMNQNITITGCTFHNVNRGVGSHSAFSGKYMDNITITNNKFNNVDGYAIITSGYRNAKITKNKITNCGAGIYYRSIIPDYSNYYKAKNAPKTDKGSVIANNTIHVVSKKNSYFNQSPYGIRVYGEKIHKSKKIDGGTLKAGDYRAKNVTIKNNKITMKLCANGIWLEGAVNNKIEHNTINYTRKFKTKDVCYGIKLVKSSHCSVQKNKITAKNIPYLRVGILSLESQKISTKSNKISK